MSVLPSVMQHNFGQVPKAEIPRSSFDRSHGLKTAFDSGYLVPIFVDEALPGDTFSLNMTGFGRLATPLRPFMDNVFVNTFFFFVPYRLIWNNFQRFMGEQANPGDSIDFDVPWMQAPTDNGYATNSIFDYFGLPTKTPGVYNNCGPLRAYNLIWNEWFRDQNLQDSVKVNKGDGPDSPADYTLLKRGKRHDYFTSALPWPQKGPAVELPLGIKAPISGIGTTGTTSAAGVNGIRETGHVGVTDYALDASLHVNWYARLTGTAGDAYPDIYADLTEATAATINQLRQAFQVQKLYERDARGGTRYTEIVRAHFNVVSPDARLQRPEYLGGGQGILNLHQVPQNSASAQNHSPQGNLAAYGTTGITGHGFTKSFTEHGFVIGLMSVRADLNYQQGINRMWNRSKKLDFYWPALAMIGEQSILNREIYAQGPSVVDPATGEPVDNLVFGYQERYAEYRYKPSLITGEMRSNSAQPLDTWHLAQNFSTLPKLNAAFIEENPPIARVLAVPSERHWLFDIYFSLRCARPMPTYGVPGLIDHF